MFISRSSILFLLALSGVTSANSLIDVSSYSSLVSDNRSFRVGEPVVIMVMESASAKSTAGTGTVSSLDFSANSFDNAVSNGVGLGVSGQREGNGQTVRQGQASTRLSATITEILPNNMIRISGEHSLLINDENQKILVSGIARMNDISKDNSIMSHRLSNALIEIQGVGVVGSAQKQNVISRVLGWLGLL